MTSSRFTFRLACWNGLLLAAVAALPAQNCTSVVTGTTSNDHFGWSIACIGDVDGDGAWDLAVGAPQASNPQNRTGQFGPGYVKVISGRTGMVLRTITAPAGASSRGLFGFSLAAFADSNGDGLPDGLGDVTGDGVPDFLVGSPTFTGARSDQGIVYIVSGASGATTAVANPATALSASEEFGSSIAVLGLMASSTRPAFAVGAKGAALASSGNAGRVDVFDWLGTSTTPSRVAFRSGTATGQFYGARVVSLGRASGNSTPDLLVSSEDVNSVGVRVVELLAANNLAVRHTFVGSFLGYGLASGGMGDITGDGRPDFAIGGRECTTCPTDLDDLATVFSWPAGLGAPVVLSVPKRPRFLMATGLGVARSLGSAGDLDRDGTPDLMIGVPLADPVGIVTPSANAGEIRIYSGATLGSIAPELLVALDGIGREELGTGAVGLGDVDQDHLADFAFAAPKHSTAAGRVVISRFVGRSLLRGSGCALPLTPNAPELHVAVDGGPCIGTTLEIHTTQLLPGDGCWFGLGLAPQATHGFPRPGCSMLISISAQVFALVGPDTYSRFTLTVPNNPSFHGLTIQAQSVVFKGPAFLFADTGTTPALSLSI